MSPLCLALPFIFSSVVAISAIPCSTPSVNCRANITCEALLDVFHEACDDVINGRTDVCSVECLRNRSVLFQHPVGMDFNNCSCEANLTCQYRHENLSATCGPVHSRTTTQPPTKTPTLPPPENRTMDCAQANKECGTNQSCIAALTNFISPDGPCSDILSYKSGSPMPVCPQNCIDAEKALSTNEFAISIGLPTCQCGILGSICTRPKENFAKFCDNPATRPPNGSKMPTSAQMPPPTGTGSNMSTSAQMPNPTGKGSIGKCAEMTIFSAVLAVLVVSSV